MANYGTLISAASPVPPAVEVRGDDPAFILYTSGTTTTMVSSTSSTGSRT
jgi:acyl-coenzyme A synthetase/AMP-(fatty) acid ligase